LTCPTSDFIRKYERGGFFEAWLIDKLQIFKLIGKNAVILQRKKTTLKESKTTGFFSHFEIHV